MTGADRQQIEARLDARLSQLTRTRAAVGPVPGPDHAVPEAVRCLDCQRHFEGAHRQRARGN